MNEPSVRSLGSSITKIKWLVDAHLNLLLSSAGLTFTPEQWSVLIALYTAPGISQTELAARTFKEKSNVGRILDLLQSRGWTERTGHPTDRRAYQVRLTSSGKAVTRAAFPIVTSLNERALSGLSTEERRTLLDLLDRVKTNLERNL